MDRREFLAAACGTGCFAFNTVAAIFGVAAGPQQRRKKPLMRVYAAFKVLREGDESWFGFGQTFEGGSLLEVFEKVRERIASDFSWRSIPLSEKLDTVELTMRYGGQPAAYARTLRWTDGRVGQFNVALDQYGLSDMSELMLGVSDISRSLNDGPGEF